MVPDKGHQKTDRSLKYFHGEAVASSLENAGAAYQSPSLVASGAAAQDVAILSSLSNLLLSVLLIKIPSLLKLLGSQKRVVLILSLVSAITWLPLILALFFFGKIGPFWLIGLWLLSLVPSLLVGPLRDNWLAESVPSRRMGRYLSVRSAISGVAYLGFFFFMGHILDASSGGIFKGYAAVLAIAFFGSVIIVVLYKMIRASKSEPENAAGDRFHFPDFIKEARQGQLGKFIIYVSSMGFAVYICTAFFTVYMLKDLHFSYVTYTIIISSEYLARVVSLAFWGKLVDKSGSMKVLRIVSWFIPIVPVLWLFFHNVAYLVVVQLVSGTVWAAHDLCNQTLISRAAPKERRLRYIIYHKSLTTFTMAAGALAGAFAINYVFPILGSQMLGMFLVSGILRLIIVLSLFPRSHGATEEEIDESTEGMPAAVWDTTVEYVPSHFGVSYRPEPAAAPVFNRVVLNTDTVTPRGVYYHPQEWVEYVKPTRGVKPGEKVVPPFRGLYYRPEEWRAYIKHTSIRKMAVCRYDVEKLMEKPLEVTLPPKPARLIPVMA